MPLANADPFNLARFSDAQAPVMPAVLEELKSGCKRSHWMWFAFPQMLGLGHSSIAQFYGIASLAEAKAYLADPTLGPRLVSCTEAVLAHRGRTLRAIFGSPDDLKFHSCMTLFHRASENPQSVFAQALNRYWSGALDAGTDRLLGRLAD